MWSWGLGEIYLCEDLSGFEQVLEVSAMTLVA